MGLLPNYYRCCCHEILQSGCHLEHVSFGCRTRPSALHRCHAGLAALFRPAAGRGGAQGPQACLCHTDHLTCVCIGAVAEAPADTSGHVHHQFPPTAEVKLLSRHVSVVDEPPQACADTHTEPSAESRNPCKQPITGIAGNCPCGSAQSKIKTCVQIFASRTLAGRSLRMKQHAGPVEPPIVDENQNHVAVT